jgi:phosphatidylserine/phosphatidylglycerophosphate/cardiolipin synthase-like enzyme
MRKSILKLALFVLPIGLALIPFTIVGAPIIPVWFTEVASTGVSSEVTEIEAALLSRINGAQNSISIAIYDFNRDSLRDALIAAHQRGVTVRVITDDEARENIASYMVVLQKI